MMTQTCSSVPVIALYVVLPLIVQRCVLCEVITCCFVNVWIILIMSGCLTRVVVTADDFDTEWDDGCPGLVEMLAREAEWKA
jgi:hypothetical protein